MEMDKLFVAILVMQLFYSFSITLVTHGMPEDSLNFVTSFSDATNQYDFDSTTSQVESSLNSQTSIPVIELGALVFYSGNIMIDLFLNFITAVPQMIDTYATGTTAGEFSDFRFFNGTNCSNANVSFLWNGGVGTNLSLGFVASNVTANFSVVALSSFDGSYVEGLSVLLDGVLWNATGSFVNTSLSLNASALKNFTLFAPGFFNRSYTNYNLSSSLVSSLDRSFVVGAWNVSGVVRSGGVNYSRVLGFSVNVSCVNDSSLVVLFNGSVDSVLSAGCPVRGGVLSFNVSADVEGLWNVSLRLNGSDGNTFNSSVGLFVFDLFAPTITSYNLSVFNGFNVVYGSADLTCNDSVWKWISYL